MIWLTPTRARARRSTPQKLADLYSVGSNHPARSDRDAIKIFLADEDGAYANARLTGRNSEAAYMFMFVGAVVFAVWAVN